MPRALSPKIQITLRLDADVIAHFKATGGGWQSRINEALRRGLPDSGAGAEPPRTPAPRGPTTMAAMPSRRSAVTKVARDPVRLAVQLGPTPRKPGSMLLKDKRR